MTALELIRRLVAFDTTSSLSNLALIEFVRDFLTGHGVDSVLVMNSEQTKANLIASIGPRVEGGVVLSGHTDVVPVAGQNWDTDPFTVTEKGGRLYGRGTADMKSFIAAALSLVPDFTARALRVPIHLAFSYDEEVGCLGAPSLLKRLTADRPRPALVIVGEPTDMKVAGAHRGISAFRTRVTGKPGHSSMPGGGVNAIAYAAECVNFLTEVAEDMRARPGDTDFDPAYTTINVGRIEGGQAVNIIAGECVFEWDCRPVPGSDAGEAARRLETHVAGGLGVRMRAGGAEEAGITTEQTISVPPLIAAPGSPAEALVLSLTGHNHTTTTAFASEAGLFQEAGIPAVVCGPGSPGQAHRPNEFIELDQVEACVAFLRRLADWAEQG
jgi:acetylornithine deacetylase